MHACMHVHILHFWQAPRVHPVHSGSPRLLPPPSLPPRPRLRRTQTGTVSACAGTALARGASHLPAVRLSCMGVCAETALPPVRGKAAARPSQYHLPALPIATIPNCLELSTPNKKPWTCARPRPQGASRWPSSSP